MKPLAWAVAAALGTTTASAVRLDAGGLGQALIYPYYTVQSVDGNAFNTYFTVVNQDANSDKALRVRFREARNGREVASFNLYLGRNDAWAGAIVPDGSGARLISADQSCTDPVVGGAGLAFNNTGYTGDNLDAGEGGLDRTREGFIEVLEMATLTGTADRLALTHTAAGIASNCAALRPAPQGPFGAPTGGLSGTLTLINVASGLDMSVNAEALAELAAAPYFRTPNDPYPAFTANEVTPTSVMVIGDSLYTSRWPRGVDAVSAVLMRQVRAEYVIDPAIGARTDIVLTFPTRHAYATPIGGLPPFRARDWTQDCGAGLRGEPFFVTHFDRRQAGAMALPSGTPFGDPALCGAVHVLPVRSSAGSPSALASEAPTSIGGGIIVRTPFTDGWLAPQLGSLPFVSLSSSTRTSFGNGGQVLGSHTFNQLPVVGFAARTFANGFLSCDGRTCLGTYGTASPFAWTPPLVSP